MKVDSIIRSGYGTRVILHLRESGNRSETIMSEHEKWPRWANAAKQIQREHYIDYPLECVDLIQRIGGLLEVQLSFMKEKTDV